MELTAKHPERPGIRPLYQQVRDLLLSRISTGAWRPAEVLPSEQALAAELGVSQGTVRKALDALAADNLVERRQGKGTFVSQHTQESALFRFFKLTADEGEPALPTCRQSSISQRRASRDEAEQLGLEPKADVFIIRRERFVDDAPRISEMMALSADLFPGLDAHHPLPNTLYAFYQSEYGVSIVGATERIKAIGADKDVSRALQVEQGRPVLSVERTALDLNGRAVEYRRSCYLTEGLHYAVRLS